MTKTCSNYKEVFYRVEWETMKRQLLHYDGGTSYDYTWSGDDQDFNTMQEAAASAVRNTKKSEKWRIVKITINSETIKEVIG